MTDSKRPALTPTTDGLDQRIRDAQANGDMTTAARLRTRRDYEELRSKVQR